MESTRTLRRGEECSHLLRLNYEHLYFWGLIPASHQRHAARLKLAALWERYQLNQYSLPWWQLELWDAVGKIGERAVLDCTLIGGLIITHGCSLS